MRSDNHPLPLPLDARQVELLRTLDQDGGLVASPGTDRFEELEHLAERDLSTVRVCPKAGGVHQFEITSAGREAIA